MTTQDKIEYIRQACIKANPSIKDLVFGCEIIDKNNTEKMHFIYLAENKVYGHHGKDCLGDSIWWSILPVTGDMSASLLVRGCTSKTKDIDMSRFEIIGREIRLADVLLAIGDNKKNWRKENWFTWVFPFSDGLNGFAGFKAYSHKGGFAMLTNKENVPVGWNLLKDSLSDQSDETIEFIFNLLK